MLVVNFFAGPGAGKSTTAAGVFSKLKRKGVNAELVTEYAKDRVWEGSLNVLENQVYVFAKQHHRLFRLKKEVDVAVTDSPLLLSIYYGYGWGESFRNLVRDTYYQFDNLNYYIRREKAYNPKGRMHTEGESKKIDDAVKDILKIYMVPYQSISGNPELSEDTVVEDVMRKLLLRIPNET